MDMKLRLIYFLITIQLWDGKIGARKEKSKKRFGCNFYYKLVQILMELLLNLALNLTNLLEIKEEQGLVSDLIQ